MSHWPTVLIWHLYVPSHFSLSLPCVGTNHTSVCVCDVCVCDVRVCCMCESFPSMYVCVCWMILWMRVCVFVWWWYVSVFMLICILMYELSTKYEFMSSCSFARMCSWVLTHIFILSWKATTPCHAPESLSWKHVKTTYSTSLNIRSAQLAVDLSFDADEKSTKLHLIALPSYCSAYRQEFSIEDTEVLKFSGSYFLFLARRPSNARRLQGGRREREKRE